MHSSFRLLISYFSRYSPLTTRIMTTHFVTAEIGFQETPAQLHSQIEAQLRSIGEPLRWAIVNIDTQRQKAIVEAVVTLASDTLTRL